MKKFFTFFILFFVVAINAQSEREPAIISTSVQKISDTEYDLIFNIKILDQWHLYSQYNPEDASLPLAISVTKDSLGFKFVGKAKESKTYKPENSVD